MNTNSFTFKLNAAQGHKLCDLLLEKDFSQRDVPYSLWSFTKPGLSITLYAKDFKLLVQGKGAGEFIEFVLEPEILQQCLHTHKMELDSSQSRPHFGVDESGKGDYLGPLVIAGVYTNKTSANALYKAGVCDSKAIGSEQQIFKLAEIIRNTPDVKYHVMLLSPKRYNLLYARFKNLNVLLAWAHAEVIAALSAEQPDCKHALSDKFAHESLLKRTLARHKLDIVLEQKVRAEADVAVAAASILAREAFVSWMNKTSARAGITLPKGASSAVTNCARQLVAKHGSEILAGVAKLHFKTTAQVLGKV